MWHNFSKPFVFPIGQTRLWDSQGLSKVCDWLRWWGKLRQSRQREMLLLLKKIQWKWTHPSYYSEAWIVGYLQDCLPEKETLTSQSHDCKRKKKKKAKQETWNTEDHCLPAFEMKDGKPHFTDILSSCKAQVAPILSLCLDQFWKRAAPLYNN